MSLKRILNELHNKIPKDLILKNLDKRFLFIELGNDIICKEIGIINKKTNNLIIKIIIPNDYPFKSCNVFLYSPTIFHDIHDIFLYIQME